MWLLLKRNARRQFKATLQGGPWKVKVSESTTQGKPPPPKKGKSDNEEKCCLVLFN